MRLFVSGMFVLAFLLSGCSPTKSESDIPSYPIPNNAIVIGGEALVNTPTLSGKASYSIRCFVQYADRSKSDSEFSSAEVTVNGVALAQSFFPGFFQNTRSMRFGQGDSLQFVITHPKIGTVKETVYVPPPVTDLTISPDLTIEGAPNRDTSFTLSWSPLSASYYDVSARGYDLSASIVLSNASGTTTTNSETVVLKDSSGNACPFVYFQVVSMNDTPCQDFAGGSGFMVGASYYQESTDMQIVAARPQVRGKIIR